MQTLTIAPQQEGKGRSFTATLLSYVTADRLWSGGGTSTDTNRPVWIMYAASEGEASPFTANLRLGRKALMGEKSSYSRKKSPCVELLKSAGYAFSTQRFSEGSVVTAYLPELFNLDPGMVDPKGASFIVLPSKEWQDTQNLDIRACVQHAVAIGATKEVSKDTTRPTSPTAEQVAGLVPLAALFGIYLDRRTRAPLVPDLRFHVQLLIACLREGKASLSMTDTYSRDRIFGQNSATMLSEHNTCNVGLTPGVAFHSYHTDIEQTLAEQVTLYYREVG